MVTEAEATILVTRLICKARRLDISQVPEDTSLVDDLGFDSLDAAELLAALHKETGLQIKIESLRDMRTIRDVVRGLVSHLPEQEKVS